MMYEVRVYKSKEMFEKYTPFYIYDGLTRKKDSLKLAKQLLLFYPIVKWQSYDREEIKIFGLTKSQK